MGALEPRHLGWGVTETRPTPYVLRCRISSFYGKTFLEQLEFRPLGIRTRLTLNTILPPRGLPTEVDRCGQAIRLCIRRSVGSLVSSHTACQGHSRLSKWHGSLGYLWLPILAINTDQSRTVSETNGYNGWKKTNKFFLPSCIWHPQRRWFSLEFYNTWRV